MNSAKGLGVLIQEAERRDQVARKRTAKWMFAKDPYRKRALHAKAQRAKQRAAAGWAAVEDARNAGAPEPEFNGFVHANLQRNLGRGEQLRGLPVDFGAWRHDR